MLEPDMIRPPGRDLTPGPVTVYVSLVISLKRKFRLKSQRFHGR